MIPRIAPLEPPYTPEIEALITKMMPPGSPVPPLALFRAMAHHADLASRLLPFASGLLNHGRLPALDRELVIQRVTARCGAEYEWGVHAVFYGERIGLDAATLAGTVAAGGDDRLWSARDAALIRAVDELHDTATISDGVWAALAEHWDSAQLIELLMLVGQYHTISYLCNALRVPNETWAARFPVVPT